jgi:hypothetical protein
MVSDCIPQRRQLLYFIPVFSASHGDTLNLINSREWVARIPS